VKNKKLPHRIDFISNCGREMLIIVLYGIVVIASAYRTEDPEFESRQGIRFLGLPNLKRKKIKF
jgi:hypothetical protein